jgi:hypothetical protein
MSGTSLTKIGSVHWAFTGDQEFRRYVWLALILLGS